MSSTSSRKGAGATSTWMAMSTIDYDAHNTHYSSCVDSMSERRTSALSLSLSDFSERVVRKFKRVSVCVTSPIGYCTVDMI